MGLITGYKNVKVHVYYYIGFDVEGKKFTFADQTGGERDAEFVLRIAKSLKDKGINPEITRYIQHVGEEITIERLEQIIKIGETPIITIPIVRDDYWGDYYITI